MSEYPDLQQRYSAAIDEIYSLRAIIASEARLVETYLGYRTFPKGLRAGAWEQVERLRKTARGEAKPVYAVVSDQKGALRSAGADECLTNQDWERQQGWI